MTTYTTDTRTRETYLPFAQPDLDSDELQEIKEVLESGWITTGPKTRQFEREFAEAVGAEHAIAVNSCTAGMHLALEAIGLERGDLVITTPYSFAATAEVIRYFGAVPVFVDVEPDTLNLDVDQLAWTVDVLTTDDAPLPPGVRRSSVVGGRLKAIIPVHVAGLPCDLAPIYDLAAEYDLAVIEDAAHSFPATYRDYTIGSSPSNLPTFQPSTLQHFTCFSFYATKTITTGEGGMITTDDEELADRCRVMALHGISKDAWKRYTAEGSWYYEIVAPGYKYNMTDIAAAMGLAQLGKVERMWQRRRDIARRYTEAFSDVPALQPPADSTHCRHAWHLYMLRLNPDRLRIDRAHFIEELDARNIGTSVHFIPLHLHPYYRETYGYEPNDFPVAYREYQREVSLPIYSKMSDRDVADVIDAVIAIAGTNRRTRT